MKNNLLENIHLKSPHYVSFMPSKRDSPLQKASEPSLQTSTYLTTNTSTRNKDHAGPFKFDFQRNVSVETPKYIPGPTMNSQREPTVLDRLLSGSKFRNLNEHQTQISSPMANVLSNSLSTMNGFNNIKNQLNTVNTSNLKTLDHFSPRKSTQDENFDGFEKFSTKNKQKIDNEMFDSIIRHIDKKFGVLENRLKITEETLANVNSERVNEKLEFERKEKEREAEFEEERKKEKEKLHEILELKEKKINDIAMKLSELESKSRFYEEKINRFQNQNETKINNISNEIQNSLNKFMKTSKEMNSKIELIYESPQVVFQKIVDDQEKIKKNNEDSLLINQRINIINEDFKERFSDFNSNFETLSQILKRNTSEIGEQKLVVNKIEEDFLKLLNFYKDLNEEIIKIKSFQEEIFHLKAKNSEIISILSNLKNKKKK